MSTQRRSVRLALGLLILACTRWPAASSSLDQFTPFAPHALPQRAQGDFDGDGRQDLALVQDGADGLHVSVKLSGSSGGLLLEATVVGLIAADIDHDGDLDLIAVAPTGQVIAWLNDGLGRFTVQEASHPNGLSRETVIVDALQDEPAALGVSAPLVEDRTRNGTAVRIARIHSHTAPLAFDLSFLSFLGLRAPPHSIALS
jgi:hypothetical protein